MLLEALNGASLHGVRFQVEVVTLGRRGLLRVETPLGSPQVDARIELSVRRPWLSPEIRKPVPLFVHQGYEFVAREVPVIALEEGVAEKLAAFRRRALVRDLYDLAWLSTIPFDEELVRKLTYLRVYVDVVQDGLGTRPFQPGSDVLARRSQDFPPEDIGLLVGQANISRWLQSVRGRFGFLTDPTPDENLWAQCSPRELRSVLDLVRALRN